MKKISIVFFSGTGGTALIAEQFARNWNDSGILTEQMSISLKDLKNQKIFSPKDTDLLLLLFPVYALDACEPVHHWLKTIPQGNALPTAVISVSGGGEKWPNSSCRVTSIKKLEGKGYSVFYENMLIMPANCVSPMSRDLSMHLLSRMTQKVKLMANAIRNKTRRRCPLRILSRIFLFVAFLERMGAKYAGKSFTAKPSCTGCGLCADLCPQENITMQNSRPSFGGNCILCLRCIYACPVRAINPGKMMIPLCKSYDLKSLLKQMEGVPLAPVEQCARGIMFKGVRDYLKNDEI